MSRSKPTLLPLVIFTLAALAFASGASAATPGRFGCRASAVRGAISSPTSTFEPTVASTSGCTDASAANAGPRSSGPIQIGVAGAFVHGQRRREAPGAASLASVTGATISSATHRVVIGSAQSHASYACAATTLQRDASSQVTGLVIDGKSIALAGPGEQVKVNIGNDGSFVQLGVETATASSVARSAAFVHLVGVGDFSLAEAVVSRSANPCAGATGFLPAVQACPTGSDYDPVKQDCAITAFTKQPIIVGTPFNTPTGGSVVAVGHARSTVAADHCLGRHGPSYVLVGSARDGGLIQATKGADRVVALGASFTIEGAGGNDCISFAGGSDTIHDGNGRVQVFGGSANDTIRLGNGRDRIKLGAGNHDVKVGNGNDVITAGPGITKLFAGHGNNRVTLSLGLSIVRLGGGNNFVRGGPGHQDIRVANGNNFIRAATGSAQIKAGDGNNRIIAGAGVDLITAGHGKNVITSGIGFDKILARGPGARVSCIDHARVTVNPAAAAFALAHKCTNVFTAS